ncbi:uncharacterized protein LOC131950272 [Physella acuta]|uniref:uncharacterized protein LOC131950272 n=1 Tax=Physella acuta TaxID=109671 RepID=UPI0027DE5CEF|nr:uncharacterized protein LOC131950272 [Physella acuta]
MANTAYAIFLETSCILGIVGTIIGVGANIINIIIFNKQGFKDATSITLTALSVGDMGMLLTGLVYNLLINPWLAMADVTNELDYVLDLLSLFPQYYFTKVCGVVAAFSALEKCMCVVFPLHVKQFITRRIAITVNIGAYIFMLSGIIPLYNNLYLEWEFSPFRNRSLITLEVRDFAHIDEFITLIYSTDLSILYLSLLCIFTCNIIIAVKLRLQSKWKRSFRSTGQHFIRADSKQKKKILMMLFTTSIFFLFCLFPKSAAYTSIFMTANYRSKDVAVAFYLVSSLTESANSSLTSLFYYSMSSNYKKSLLEVFSCFRGSSLGTQEKNQC